MEETFPPKASERARPLLPMTPRADGSKTAESKSLSRTSPRAKSRFSAIEQALYVSAVTNNDHRREKNRQRHERHWVRKKPKQDRRRERGAERAERYDSARQSRADKYREQNQSHLGRQGQ